MKDELLHDLKKSIVNLKTKVDLLASEVSSVDTAVEEAWAATVKPEEPQPQPQQQQPQLLLDLDENTTTASNGDQTHGHGEENHDNHDTASHSGSVIDNTENTQVGSTKTDSSSGPDNKNKKYGYTKPKRQAPVIRDNEPELKKLCIMVEKVFRRGLRQQSSVFGIVKKDYWSWLEFIACSKSNTNPHFSIIINKIKSSAKFLTAQGRGRCFIRAALNKKILHVPIEMLYKNSELLFSIYDPLTSLFTNEDSREFILGVFSLLSAINFDLKIRNASFLDETWELPIFHQLELVPSDDLGLTIRYVQSRAIVVDADPFGVAGEDGKVEIGDVLDEVHQISVYDARPVVIQQILQDHSGWPITIGVIKPRLGPSGAFFQPIEKRLLEISLAYPSIKRLLDSAAEKAAVFSGHRETTVCIEGKQYWLCVYIGHHNVGSVGGSQLIEPTIQTILSKRDTSNDKQVLLAAYEADVTVLDRSSKEHLWTHSFPEISSCGRRVDHSSCFAYIVGNNICNVADSFVCHLFEAPNADISRDILQNIAHGFKRTTWLT